ncbi:hypothetical protein BMS3Abin07_00161 [bacterium BMS3Abin07]|nr:hypothetical protein BMS3Abin07_00161 [bacterium BMS3Abin07]GBE33490.1 hypothetical protein BMS3Bbin05_02431 [bacterium BMS3Bbin05]
MILRNYHGMMVRKNGFAVRKNGKNISMRCIMAVCIIGKMDFLFPPIISTLFKYTLKKESGTTNMAMNNMQVAIIKAPAL